MGVEVIMKKSILANVILRSMVAGDAEEMLQMSYTSQEMIPEAYRNLYTENNGTFALTQVQGIKTQQDVNNVMESLRKERNDHSAIKQKYSVFGDKDPNEILTQLDRIAELEAAAAGAKSPEELETLVAARLQTKTGPLERELAEVKTQLQAALEESTEYKTQIRNSTIANDIRAAAVKAKVRPEAIDDLIFQGQTLFDLDETGKSIAKAGGSITPGIMPEVWLTELKQIKPFYWPASQGVGAKPGFHMPGGGLNPFTKEGWNKTQQYEMVRNDREKAEQMAKAAGVEIGATKPAK